MQKDQLPKKYNSKHHDAFPMKELTKFDFTGDNRNYMILQIVKHPLQFKHPRALRKITVTVDFFLCDQKGIIFKFG